jgi:hypothetical protein
MYHSRSDVDAESGIMGTCSLASIAPSVPAFPSSEVAMFDTSVTCRKRSRASALLSAGFLILRATGGGGVRWRRLRRQYMNILR